MVVTAPSNGHVLRLATDRPDAVYEMGDTVVFRLESCAGTHCLPRSLAYSLTWDGWTVIEEGIIARGDLPWEVSVTPTQGGFLRLTVECRHGAGAQILQAAAAVSPEGIPPSMPVPRDFKDFWLGQATDDISGPPVATVERYARHAEGSVHKVVVRMPGDGNIHGWLLKPHGAGPFPALVRYHGAGVYPVPPENGLDWARRGVMVLSINPHAIPNNRAKDFYEALRTGQLADYRTRGRTSRESVYFREMFLRALRAAEFLAEEQDWDGRNLILEGHSQGGAQALAAAALNDEVSCIAISCSTHCDHTGPVIGRVPGWPRIVEIRHGVPDPIQVEAARYIDGVNFASLVRCPAMFSLGFLDDLCPPTGIYAAYNKLMGPKTIRHEIATGHVHTDACRVATYKWVAQQIAGPS